VSSVQAAGSAEPDSVSRALTRLRAIVDEHDRGELADREYEAAKAEIFGLADDPA